METRSAHNISAVNASATGPNICRICLTKGTSLGDGGTSRGMESIFATVGEYEEKSMYGILVMICAPLGQREMLMGMPERICRSCKWRLLSAYELYETCLRSDDQMRKVFNSRKMQPPQDGTLQVQIKQEVPDHYESDFKADATGDTDAQNSFLMENHYFPDAESTQLFDNSEDLLVEMPLAADPNETLFEEHYKVNEKGNHSCGICDQEFPYKSQARTHIIVKHDPTKPFKCDECHYTLTTELRLIRHKATTHGVGVIKIEEKIPDEKEDSGDTTYACKICSKTFASLVRFKRHRNVHVVYNRPFKCDICLYRFPNRAQLTQHVKTHQEKPVDSDQVEWKCDYCEEKLPGKRAHTMHIRRFHPQELQNECREDKNEYKCIICSEAFARESVLNTHMKMHELLAFEKEKGQRQELEFLVKKELQAQLPAKKSSDNNANVSNNEVFSIMNNSTKKKSDVDVAFVCMVCEQEFEERELLLKHQKKLHTELQLNIVSGGPEESTPTAESIEDAPTADIPASVEKDEKEEKDEESTNDTTKNAGDDEPMVIDLDPAQLLAQTQSESELTKGGGGAVPPPLPKCDLCQKTFMYNCLLQTHIKNSHSETKPFECKVCHMRFGYRGTLQKHELTHSAQNIRPGGHGSIMYKCKVCFAKFLELKSLTNHLKTHRTPTVPAEAAEPKKIEIFQCTFCPQIFNGKDELDGHQTKVHRQMLPQRQTTPVVQQHHHSRKNPEPRKLVERAPMNEKELFFDSLSIVKLEHPASPVRMEMM